MENSHQKNIKEKTCLQRVCSMFVVCLYKNKHEKKHVYWRKNFKKNKKKYKKQTK